MKTVLITGATRSIGLETAKQLIQKGHFVYLGSRNLEKGEETVKELNSQELKTVRAVQIDVTDVASILVAKDIIEKESEKLDRF